MTAATVTHVNSLNVLILTRHVSCRPLPTSVATYQVSLMEGECDFPVFTRTAHDTCHTTLASSPSERLVLAMVDEGFHLHDIDRLPYGVALPLRESLRSCRHMPPGDWPREAYLLVGRNDLAMMDASSMCSSNGDGDDDSNTRYVVVVAW